MGEGARRLQALLPATAGQKRNRHVGKSLEAIGTGLIRITGKDLAMVKTLFGILLSAMFLFAMGPGDGRQVLGCQEGDVIEIPEVGGLHHRYERRAA